MKLRVVAVGSDAYWLKAVHGATANWAGETKTLKCPADLQKCISDLPTPGPGTVLLVDASGQGDMETVVAALRANGWNYVIVVAADPSAKEATAILRRNLGYDYWEKTYDEEDIRRRVQACLDEITAELPSMTRKHNRSTK